MSAVKSISEKDMAQASDAMSKSEPYTIRCYLYSIVGPSSWTMVLSGERLLAAQAMRLLMGLDRELIEARAQWNQNWFRRLMRARSKAVSRLQRRWLGIIPPAAIPLGSLRRRYHANLAGHLYEPRR